VPANRCMQTRLNKLTELQRRCRLPCTLHRGGRPGHPGWGGEGGAVDIHGDRRTCYAMRDALQRRCGLPGTTCSSPEGACLQRSMRTGGWSQLGAAEREPTERPREHRDRHGKLCYCRRIAALQSSGWSGRADPPLLYPCRCIAKIAGAVSYSGAQLQFRDLHFGIAPASIVPSAFH